MNRKFKKELKSVFEVEPSKRKNAFIKQLSYPKSHTMEVILSQVGYIRKSFWIVSFGLVAFMMAILKTNEMSTETIAFLSAVLPFFSLLGVGELHKSISHNMAELELSCKHNLGEVTLIRLVIVSSVSVCILLMSIFIAKDIGFGLYRNTLYMTVPFLISSYLSLWIINRFKTRETIYVSGGVTVCISVLQIVCSTSVRGYYMHATMEFWVIVLLATIGLLTYEIVKLVKKTEELAWN